MGKLTVMSDFEKAAVAAAQKAHAKIQEVENPEEIQSLLDGVSYYVEYLADELNLLNPHFVRDEFMRAAGVPPTVHGMPFRLSTLPKYVVYEHHTLGYLIKPENHENPWLWSIGILRASILKGSPYSDKSGPIAYSPYRHIRAATAKDFQDFKVTLPPDFGSKP